jgi:N-acetylglucosamine repressor
MLSSSFIEMRRRNAVRILQTVREQPGLSRADIARTCDLAKSTVSSVVGCKESSRGRRPVGLSFNSSSRITVGISLDHTRTEIVLSNLDGVVQSVRTKKHQRRNNIQSISTTQV